MGLWWKNESPSIPKSPDFFAEFVPLKRWITQFWNSKGLSSLSWSTDVGMLTSLIALAPPSPCAFS